MPRCLVVADVNLTWLMNPWVASCVWSARCRLGYLASDLFQHQPMTGDESFEHAAKRICHD